MADKRNDAKKKAEDHDESLSDSDSSLPDIECDTCGMSFTNVKNYGAHMQSKKHRNKVAEAKFKAKSQASGKKMPEDEQEEDAEEEEEEPIHCEVCDKSFSGFISYEGHVKGTGHKKNLKKEKLKKQLKDMPEVIEKGSEDDDDDLILKPYARCKVCQKEFSGPESFKMHLKSAAHQKKEKISGTLQKMKTELAGGSDDDDDQFFKKCGTCQKSFSGVVPYKTHMLSNVHKKNLERKKVAEEIKELCDVDDSGYTCRECKKLFTDPLALKSHLQNNSHDKMKAKEALVEFLNAHPEIEFVTPFDKKEGGSDSEEEDSDSRYYLICKLCHVSFSGPESAQDHVKSKKHVSAKKEKKMRKLLKEQMNNNSPKSGAGNGKSDENSSAPANAAPDESKSKNGRVYSVDDFEMV